MYTHCDPEPDPWFPHYDNSEEISSTSQLFDGCGHFPVRFATANKRLMTNITLTSNRALGKEETDEEMLLIHEESRVILSVENIVEEKERLAETYCTVSTAEEASARLQQITVLNQQFLGSYTEHSQQDLYCQLANMMMTIERWSDSMQPHNPSVVKHELTCTKCHGYARIPYDQCSCCWDSPSYHHGRCCPRRCWICQRYAAIPFRSCDYCGDRPSNHRGRCCPQYPANRNHQFEWHPSY